MLLKLIYVVVILITFSICKIIYREVHTTTIRKIHHYHINNNEEDYNRKKAILAIKKELLYDYMKEILYGHEYKVTIPEGINPWWQDPPGRNGTHIFPDGG